MPQQNDAIQPDVSTEPIESADATIISDADTSTTERPKSARELGMELMEARRREQLVAEGVQIEAPAEKPADTDAQITAQTEIVDEPVIEEPKDAKTDDVPQMVRVKVNGVEELVPLARVIAQYQKGEAAEKRLDEATRLLEEARAAHAEAKPADKKEAAEKIAEAATNLVALKKQFFDAMYDGNQDKANESLDQIINESVATALKERAPATPDEASIIAKVAPAVEQSLALRSALRQFQKDFPEIAKDSYLASRADAFLNEALTAGKAHEDAFKEAGERTRGWMRDALGIKTEVTAATARTERTERKAEIDNPPSASGKTVVPEPATEGNPSATIAEMRRGRPGG